VKLKKFYERMDRQDDPSEWSLEKIHGITSKKELDILKKL